ncbi:MAG: FxsA [Rhodobacteraceae bacterium]|nr:FxsA [Paracoccaceae bacterium]|tara:strand:+ start:17 stop:466 length:450 start_codon:yes stop_codon:yes gene_type:complete
MWLFVVFIIVPIVEIALFIEIGALLGLWPTIMIVILTAIIGTRLVKSQGLNAVKNIQNSIIIGQNITDSLINGALILTAGLLLLTPGFFTDAVGISLLIPQTRALWIKYGSSYVMNRVVFGTAKKNTSNTKHNTFDSDAIDGEYTDLDK